MKHELEAGFKLSSDTWLQPDVSFLRTFQIDASDPDGYYKEHLQSRMRFSRHRTGARRSPGKRSCIFRTAQTKWSMSVASLFER